VSPRFAAHTVHSGGTDQIGLSPTRGRSALPGTNERDPPAELRRYRLCLHENGTCSMWDGPKTSGNRLSKVAFSSHLPQRRADVRRRL